MKCLEREKLFAYSQHMLESHEEAEVDAHLEACPRCRELVNEFQTVDAVLDEWRATEPSAWFDARVRAAIAASGPFRSPWFLFGLKRRRWLSPVWLGVLVVVFSVAFLRIRRSQDQPQSVAQLPVQATSQPAPVMAKNHPGDQAEEELGLYQDLPVLEDKDYDMLANFDLLSDLPKGEKRVVN